MLDTILGLRVEAETGDCVSNLLCEDLTIFRIQIPVYLNISNETITL